MKKTHYSVYWAESAQNDLEAIIDYISNESINNAMKIYSQIKDSCVKLELFPNIGHIPNELKEINIESYKEITVSVWSIIYRINSDEVNILAVFDSRRDIEDALLGRILLK